MQVRYTPSRAGMQRLVEVCRKTDLAMSAAVRVAIEWHEANAGRPLPPTTERHRSFCAKMGESPQCVLLYIPKAWSDALGGTKEAIRLASTATVAWIASGHPTDLVQRTSEQTRLKMRSLKDNADVGSMVPVKLQLGGARPLILAEAERMGVSPSALVRRIAATNYTRLTGRTLAAAFESAGKATRARERQDNAMCVSFPISWLVAFADTWTGSRQAFVQSSISEHYGLQPATPSVQPHAVAMVSARMSRAAFSAKKTAAPRLEMEREVLEQSRWPDGCGVRAGSITGRACVVRVEGAARWTWKD